MKRQTTARTVDHYDGESGEHVVTMPRDAAFDCSRPGQPADDAVAHWVHHPSVRFHVTSDRLRLILRTYGAWEADELTADDDVTIQGRVLWLAACDYRENIINRRRYGGDS